MTTKVHALFYDDHSQRDLLAVGIYTPPEKGGWQDGKRSEPDIEASMELYEILSPDGGNVDYGAELECAALQALWKEIK